MKILHLFDCAASACLIAREQRKAGHEAIVSSFASMDPFGFLDYYGEHRMKVDSSQWAQYVMDKLVPDYDIIHVHFMWGLIPHIKARHGDDKKIIMHYQGSDARTFPTDLERKHAESLADAVLYSIGDIAPLMPDRAVRFYAPIDTEMFHPLAEIATQSKALCYQTQPSQLDKKLVIDWLFENGWRGVDVVDRTKLESQIPYSKIQKHFSQFGTYIDIRYQNGKVIDDWSSTAEQFLNMGIPVYDWNNELRKGLDSKYKSENVLKQLKSTYETITK